MCEVTLRCHKENICMEQCIEWSFSPACSTGTTVTAACVERAQSSPVTADQLKRHQIVYTADGNRSESLVCITPDELCNAAGIFDRFVQ